MARDARPASARTDALVDQRAMDEARLELLRRRFVTFSRVVGGLVVALAVVPMLLRLAGAVPEIRRPQMVALVATAASGLAIALLARQRQRRLATRSLAQLAWRAGLIVLIVYLGQVPSAAVTAQWLTSLLRSAGFTGAHIGLGWPMFVSLALVHASAALVVPWTVREAARPILIASAITAAGAAIADRNAPAVAFGLGATLLAGAPGVVFSWFRHSRFRDRVAMGLLSDRYEDMQRELELARRVHERLFPAPISHGPIRLGYAYKPMRQIGGDYLEIAHQPGSALVVVLVDVTGHGISAALAVNRIHGELKRIMAQPGGASPGAIVGGLNEYVALTLADERIFATALAACVDGRSGQLRYCSGGHPPMMLRRAGGAVERLGSTAMMLGVLPGAAYEAPEDEAALGPGDALIAFTDGAIEAMDRSGRQLGLGGLEQAMGALPAAGDPGALCTALMDYVDRHRAGQIEDDTLIVALCRGPG